MILPIGLASSYVLANWYLKEFDKRITQHLNPVHYSRYVDDIFLVLANQDFDYLQEEKCELILKHFSEKYDKELFDNLKTFEKLVLFILDPVIVLKTIKGKIVGRKKELDSYLFKIACYDSLYIQPDKTLVYFFDHKSSLSVIEKFVQQLDERSSEFRFLPDEEIEKQEFDDDAYELVYDDSQWKIKTLKDYKENRYGLATHLSKKIFYYLRSGTKNSKKDANKVLKFFKGITNLENFYQWERLVTYFIVNNNKNEFLNFYANTLEQIFQLQTTDNFNSSEIGNIRIVEDFIEFFAISVEMSLALNPKFLEGETGRKFEKVNNRFSSLLANSNNRPKSIKNNWRIFRLSNLLRHYYVVHSLMNYTNLSKNEDISLVELDLTKINGIGRIAFDAVLLTFSPRNVKFWECAWAECVYRIYTYVPNPQPQPFINRIALDILNDPTNYLDDAYEMYYQINYWYIFSEVFKQSLKDEIFKEVLLEQNNNNVLTNELTINRGQPILSKVRIGIANMKVPKEDFRASMLGLPILENRYNKFAKVLNIAEEERCDIIALPELCLPYSLAKTVIERTAEQHRAVIIGIEHWTHLNIAYNFILTSLPCKIRGVDDSVPVLRLKNHYAPLEEFVINGYRRIVPKQVPSHYHLFRWQGVYFAVYYCFELADIIHRSLFRSKIDFLIASEWNPDTPYYSNITELTSRDIHCYFIQVNTSEFGDSRVTRPSKTDIKDSLRIKGGKNTTLLVDEIEIDKLREFQYKSFALQKDDKEFKPTPADYKHDDVRIRMENRSFGGDH